MGNIIINIPVTSKLHNNNNNSLKNLKYLFFFLVGFFFFFKIFIHKALFVKVSLKIPKFYDLKKKKVFTWSCCRRSWCVTALITTKAKCLQMEKKSSGSLLLFYFFRGNLRSTDLCCMMCIEHCLDFSFR